jgi:hypothetical protein
MATIEQTGGKTWTGLAVAWGCTVIATIALGLVAVTAPQPHLVQVEAPVIETQQAVADQGG